MNDELPRRAMIAIDPGANGGIAWRDGITLNHKALSFIL
jgi:hypothetical protein